MPVYEYACTDCSEQLEVRQSFTDDALTVCPTCDGRLRKILSTVGVVFKGSGFYHTDSRAKPTSDSDTSSTEATKEKSDSSASDSSGSDTSASKPENTPPSDASGSERKASQPAERSRSKGVSSSPRSTSAG